MSKQINKVSKDDCLEAIEIVYGYEDCFDCHIKADQFKGIGLEVGSVNGKMYYQCTNCDFVQVG